ncbi:beta-Ig-H3/fasciclin [Calothrix brevissima NIES-22]|nr:beta-Ig-H3/fasciclin [Calothrix brevissima NIES-22]
MADLVETAIQAGNFNTLVQAVEAVGLTEVLKRPGSLTIFAPTDDAFAQLPAGTLDKLLQDIPKLKKIVAYHVASGDVRSDDLVQINEAETLEGSILAIESTHGAVKINDANVLQTDILADNGVIHVIDAVLIPALIAGGTSSSVA